MIAPFTISPKSEVCGEFLSIYSLKMCPTTNEKLRFVNMTILSIF